MRIDAFDQVDLPLPVPAFELFFAGDGISDVIVKFVVEQVVAVVPVGKNRSMFIFMLVKPAA